MGNVDSDYIISKYQRSLKKNNQDNIISSPITYIHNTYIHTYIITIVINIYTITHNYYKSLSGLNLIFLPFKGFEMIVSDDEISTLRSLSGLLMVIGLVIVVSLAVVVTDIL